jgi:hypothetical protein
MSTDEQKSPKEADFQYSEYFPLDKTEEDKISF